MVGPEIRHRRIEQTEVNGKTDFQNSYCVGVNRGRFPVPVYVHNFTGPEAEMNPILESILFDLSLALTATDRIILLSLSAYPLGQRIEDIARLTGSKYRWIANQVSKLTRLGVLRRVAPNTYAINSDREVSQ